MSKKYPLPDYSECPPKDPCGIPVDLSCIVYNGPVLNNISSAPGDRVDTIIRRLANLISYPNSGVAK